MYIKICIILLLIFSLGSNYNYKNKLFRSIIGSWKVDFIYNKDNKLNSDINKEYHFFQDKKGFIIKDNNIIKRFYWQINKKTLSIKEIDKNKKKYITFNLKLYKDIPYKLTLFEKDESLNIQTILTKNLSLELYDSIINNNKEKIMDLINIGVNLNIKYKFNNTPLHISAYKGNDDISLFLIKRLSTNSIYIKNNDGKTPIDIAKENNYPKLISLFKEQNKLYKDELYKDKPSKDEQYKDKPSKDEQYTELQKKIYKKPKSKIYKAKKIKKVKKTNNKYNMLMKEDRPPSQVKINKRKKYLEIISKTD